MSVVPSGGRVGEGGYWARMSLATRIVWVVLLLLLVVQVADGSGAEAGLAIGDVITQIGSTPVNNGREFVAAVRKLSAGQTVPLTVARRGNSLILALRLEPQDSAR